MNGWNAVGFSGAWRPLTGVVFLVLLAIAGCGGGPQQPVQTEYLPFTPDQMAAQKAAKSAVYRLRSGDRLAVDFKYEDELDSRDLLVLPDGHLTLPGGVDPVLARGLTITELDSALTAVYGQDYRRPDLSVLVQSIGDLHVYVYGYVERPGEVTLRERHMGVMQAIAAAGGFNRDAKPSETAVVRVTEDGFMLRRIDFSHLEQRGLPGYAALDLQPYDVIYVPRSTLGDIDYFTNTFMDGLLDVSRLFWDFYAISHLNSVTTLYR